MGGKTSNIGQQTRGFRPSASYNGREAHSEDIQDIIGQPPSALLRWGITWVLFVLIGIIALSAFIRYPDIVRAPVRINAVNAPKAVICRLSGSIVNILVNEGDTVKSGQPLAWMESTADHAQVARLMEILQHIREGLYSQANTVPANMIAPSGLRLGELQPGYQTFYQSYLTYQAATGSGIYLKRRAYILSELQNVKQQRAQLESQGQLQQQEYELAEGAFNRYQQLADRKVISPAEYQQQQALLLAKRHPLQQTQSALLSNEASQTAKVKELADLDNQIAEERSKFLQALNSLISEIQQWKLQYVLTAPANGSVVFAGIIQRNQHVDAGQEVFHVNPGSSDFFGEVILPQYNMGKVKEGQEVLVKLDSYPFEEYGALSGQVGRLSAVPYRDSIFLSRVDFRPMVSQKTVQLTTGMSGTAEIITEDASLLQRLFRNIRLVLNER